MTQTLTRTGIVEPSGDGSDPFDPVTYLRNIAAWAEAKAAQFVQQSATPTAGVQGRFFKDSDNLGDGILYYDNGTTLEAIGTSSAVDAAAGVGSLRTLGAGALQAAAGNHTHAIGTITGAGGAAALNVGTTTGTVADGGVVAGLAAAAPRFAGKASADVVTAGTATDIGDLSVALTSGTWQVTVNAPTTGQGSTPTGQFNLAYTGSTAGVGALTAVVSDSNGSNVRANASNNPFATFNNSGTLSSAAASVLVTATLTVTTAGTLTFQGKLLQGTSVTVLAGSSLTALKVA